jgi:hypothetical protein
MRVRAAWGPWRVTPGGWQMGKLRNDPIGGMSGAGSGGVGRGG